MSTYLLTHPIALVTLSAAPSAARARGGGNDFFPLPILGVVRQEESAFVRQNGVPEGWGVGESHVSDPIYTAGSIQ
jgi:hypothetical protein